MNTHTLLPPRCLRHLAVWPVLCLGLTLSAPAQAEWGQSNYDYAAERAAWQEADIAPPAFPVGSGTRIPFEVSATSPHQHFIDFDSVSVGPDKVVRYTVILQSQGGAENITFEGMRCKPGVHKTYAFGRRTGPDAGTWTKNKYADWRPVPDRADNSYQRALFYGYFCAGGQGEPDLARIQGLLRRGGYKQP